MKRFLSLLVIGIMLATPVFAETIDVSAMSLEELLALRNTVNTAISERIDLSFNDSKIGTGVYVVGKDIKPGRYDLICTFSKIKTYPDGSTGYSLCEIDIFPDASDDASSIYSYSFIALGQQFAVELKEGNVLHIKDGNFQIQKSEHSWAP